MPTKKMYTLDKFLGLNQAGDGDTELKLGEASRMLNFTVTDAHNLRTRPGVLRAPFDEARSPSQVLDCWAGYLGTRERIVVADFLDGSDRLTVFGEDAEGEIAMLCQETGLLGLSAPANTMILDFSGAVYIFAPDRIASLTESDTFELVEAYVPLVIAGASPSGGGTEMEKINLLSGKRRVTFSADGESTQYFLPEESASVSSVTVDNVPYTAGAFDASTHCYTFSQAPAKGVGNVEITYSIPEQEAARARRVIASCTLHEEFNGATDTRVFLAGDGSNRCYYSGVTQDGTPSALYFPAMNEVAVDMSGSAVTAITRHYSRLLVFTQDGAFAITYEPVTLPDGATVAGFYVRSVNREYGNVSRGQVRTVNNYPRSFCSKSLVEWRITNSNYRDERYAVPISAPVRKFMQNLDYEKLIAWDDDGAKTYYIFTNDASGTVLVHRYGLGKEGAWCAYQGDALRGVRFAFTFRGGLYFVSDRILHFVDSALYDNTGDGSVPIEAFWESGFLSFGADFLRKYASQIYVSVLPQANSVLSVTVETDRKTEYTEKYVRKHLFDFPALRFPTLTFKTNQSPQLDRVRMKVKKFLYYKLKLQVTEPGSRATILGADLEIRYGAKTK